MSARAVRRVVVAVFVLGIAGMIAGSVADNAGFALTAGLITAVAAVCLMVATAVAPTASGSIDEAAGARLEEQVARLVAAGAPEEDVRELVRLARAIAPKTR